MNEWTLENQIDRLKALQDGWLWGQGVAPSHDGLDRLHKAFLHYDTTLPMPSLTATEEGGVHAEWTIGNWSATLEISLSDLSAEWLAVDVSQSGLDNPSVREDRLDLTKASQWQRLARMVSELCQGA